MHARARRLADDQDARWGGGLHHGTGPEREVRFASAAGADLGQQGVEVSLDMVARDGNGYGQWGMHAEWGWIKLNTGRQTMA
jgi:hypothetical protein